ncbi:AraC family transcriptional regulator [Paenibacillus doosanensis]|uniref:HTH-type transcriptional activator Btr n=1 Tax=Paenibacillus konkukensis TaxID=2020716 RepID=A0ABY4RV04_9BACL|nr:MULTISPECIES: AraC family transcriptional regulator [Paenibacillus]MCS7460710.1 AraC family transcriptional regulator [Paenibacillus doosanensis]UQZ85892.1 HTH-type transcriptional activator Btr [Paenibacillus konkukensis]
MRIHHEIKGIQYGHRRIEQPPKMDFHLHDRFEIYFFIAGDVQYFIEKSVYPLAYGDLLIMNNRELHKATFRSDAPYENIVIHFDPEAIRQLTSAFAFDLLDCFTNRPQGEQNKIHLHPHQLEEIVALYHKMDSLFQEPDDGSELLLAAYCTELLVLLNRAFRHNFSPLPSSVAPEKLAPVLDYIDHHLDHDLSLEALEQQFFMNRYYLSRLFRQSTGSTIHEYILLKRIARAKKLLFEGHNVTDACQLSGFNDYSNFIRMFKRFVGVPPGQYRKQK